MYNSTSRFSFLILAAALLAGQNAMATKVYQWTDNEGVVHFSDVPPKDDPSADIQEMEFVNFEDNGSDPDHYSISNQLQRMAEWRRQISEERLARKQLQLEEQRIAQERNANSYNDDPRVNYQAAYYPYPVYYIRYPQWHGHHGSGNHPGTGGHHGKTGGGSFKSKIDIF